MGLKQQDGLIFEHELFQRKNSKVIRGKRKMPKLGDFLNGHLLTFIWPPYIVIEKVATTFSWAFVGSELLKSFF